MKAMVLAAGLGTRLRPLTYEITKPMVPVLDRPVMEHIVELLERHGFDEVIANLHYFPDSIREYFGERLSYRYEEELLGTAGGVRGCADFFGDEPFLVISGDALTDIDAHTSGARSSRICPAIVLNASDAKWPIPYADAVFCCNMIHIAPWSAAEGLFAGSSRILSDAAPLILYGPFRRQGRHTAPSNHSFDDELRVRNSGWGVRCLETEVIPLAEKSGFALDEVVAMPANNLTVIFRRALLRRR